jgi:DNA polymerase III subunit delta
LILEYKEIIKNIRQKQYKPVYFLHGEEPYFMDAITEVIENEILNESEQSFNQTILYGKDIKEVQQIVDNAMRYPMMAQHQVIVIKEAQDIDFLKKGGDNPALERLKKYIETPLSSTVLCFAYKHKKLDMRTAFAKALVKYAVVLESKPLYDNQIPDFIRNWLKDNKLTIENNALDLMVEYLGTDLGKIVNELEKLKINLQKGETAIKGEHIEKYIGISREYNVFELQKALGSRNILQANKIINYFIANPKDAPLVVVMSNLYGFFSKIYQLSFIPNQSPADQVKTLGLRSEWFLKDYVVALRHYPRPKTEQVICLLKEFDLKSKGVNSDGVEDGQLLKELVYKILH